MASTGRAPEIQIAAVRLVHEDLLRIAGKSGGLEAYFLVQSSRGTSYINLDGAPGTNFAMPQDLLEMTS
jgi:hypothetical protein